MNKINNPFEGQKQIKITMGFDVSTTRTGYAVLVNGRPAELSAGSLSIGQIDMIKTDDKGKTLTFDNYGDKMFHGAFDAIQEIATMVYQVIAPINAFLGNLKKLNIAAEKSKQAIRHDVPNIDVIVVFEKSDIPTSITRTTKLNIFMGMVFQAVSNVLHNAGFHFSQNVSVKVIKPTEHQERLWDKAQAKALDTKTEKGSKIMAVAAANKHLVEWGLQTIPYEFNDMADAINMAVLADVVRDNVFAASSAKSKEKRVKINLQKDILMFKNKIADLEKKARTKQQVLEKQVIWAMKQNPQELSGKDKAKFTRLSKYELDEIRTREITSFLSPEQQRVYNNSVMDLAALEQELKEERHYKVLKG